jgi:hypothetical protein
MLKSLPGFFGSIKALPHQFGLYFGLILEAKLVWHDEQVPDIGCRSRGLHKHLYPKGWN